MPKHTFAKSLTLGATAVAAIALVAAAPATTETEVSEPDSFTSAYTVMATPDAVINNDGDVTPGEPGSMGQFDFRINSDLNIICYDITLTGVTGEYESPAKTATHIHEAAEGRPARRASRSRTPPTTVTARARAAAASRVRSRRVSTATLALTRAMGSRSSRSRRTRPASRATRTRLTSRPASCAASSCRFRSAASTPVRAA